MRTNFNMAEENITMIRGDSIAFNLVFVGEDRGVTLGHAYFTAKKSKESTAKAFQKTLGDGIEQIGTGEYSVTIDPEDTDDLDPGRYWYDFRVAVQGQVFTIMWGILDIIQEVAENVDSGGGDPGGGGGDEPVGDVTEYHYGDDIKATSTSYVNCPITFALEEGSTIYITFSYQDGNNVTQTGNGTLTVQSPYSVYDDSYTHMSYAPGDGNLIKFNSKTNGKTVKILEVSYSTSENVHRQDMNFSIVQGETATVELATSPVTGTKIMGIIDWNGGGKGWFEETAGTPQSRLGVQYDGDKTLTFSASGTNVGYDVYYVAP